MRFALQGAHSRDLTRVAIGNDPCKARKIFPVSHDRGVGEAGGVASVIVVAEPFKPFSPCKNSQQIALLVGKACLSRGQ